MPEGLSRQSAEIIPFPVRRARSAGADMRALEAEAARVPAAVDTTGWYHEEAIEEDHRHAGHNAWRF